MMTSRGIRKLATTLAAVLFSMLVAGTAIAERWYILSTDSFGAGSAVDLDSIGPAPGYPSAITVMVFVHKGIDTFSCAPPGDCIATSQLTYYYVDCGMMVAAEIRRTPMNLRDKVIATIDAPYPVWIRLVWHRVDLDRDEDSLQFEMREVERRHREVRVFCAHYNAGKVNGALR